MNRFHSPRSVDWLLFFVAGGLCMVATVGAMAQDKDQGFGPRVQKTGDYPHALPIRKPSIAWTCSTVHQRVVLSTPAVLDGVLYCTCELGTVHAFETKSGAELWQTWLGPNGERSCFAPFVDKDGVYCASENGGVTALDRATGATLWKQPIELGATAPLKSGNTVFAAGYDGNVYAFDAESGDTRWTCSFLVGKPADPPAFPGRPARLDGAFVRPQRVEGTLARPGGSASDGKLLFQSIFDQSRVVAVDCKTGKIVWSFQAAGGIFAEPTVTAEYVFVGSHDRHLFCLDKQTGRMIWKFATQGPIEAGTAFRDDSVCTASCDGSLYRLDVKTGKPLWIFRTNPVRRHATAIYSAPRIIGDNVCFASAEGWLYAVNFVTGQLLWKIDDDKSSDMCGAPATDGCRLFVQTRTNATMNGVDGIAAFDEAR